MALIKKNNQTSPTKKEQIIKVNPYENPENVMELMSSVCSATPSSDMDFFWNPIREAYNRTVNGKSLYEYISDSRYSLSNIDFDRHINQWCSDLSFNLSLHENTHHTQIVIAGGFSSGKSSFLNRITNSVNLLPTGVEPVSVVKTYLYCSKDTKVLSVKGVNQKNVLVNLNPGVLQAIQHAKESNIYLASVLEKLFVEIPSNNLDGLVFIDTPGYNNSDKANKSNGKTDRETALEAMKEGNVLFWLIDCERGTTVSDDIEIIKQFDGKKVFIFNKADKKGENECRKIVDAAAETLLSEFSSDEIIDILAYSTLENKIYYSFNGLNIESIIGKAKDEGNGVSGILYCKKKIEELFDDEIAACQCVIEDIEGKYEGLVQEKNRCSESYENAKEFKDYVIKSLDEVLVKSYNELMIAADCITKSSKFALDSFLEFYKGVMNFEINDHWGSSSILNAAISKADKAYDKAVNKHNLAIEYKYYEEEYRKELVSDVQSEEDLVVDRFKEWYEEECEKCTDMLDRKEREEKMMQSFSLYKDVMMNAVNDGIREYRKRDKATIVEDNSENETPNVFKCIENDDYKSFLHSFENGVDMSVCNSDGYSPLTLAVRYGNNAMVQFMLKHGADSSAMDKRGYNAFHTAVENQFRDLCEILLKEDPDIISTKTNSGEDVETLANKLSFSKWIINKINNAL